MTGFDLIVAGAGPAGLAAAALAARGGKRVALVCGPPAVSHDPRTVALMQPSINLLNHLGLWPGRLMEHASPLKRLRLVDDTGSLVTAPEMVFEACEMDAEWFGWNVPLAVLVTALRTCAGEAGVTPIEDLVTGARRIGDAIQVELASGAILTAPVAIAADGRTSVLRQAAGIAVKEWSYDQMAIATSFAHSMPHRDTSTEYHRPGGPFTTVPLRGNRSSLVWMERPARAGELMALDDARLAAEIQIATHGELGLVSETGPRRLFDMKGMSARELAKNRVMLVGEAGHVAPPIGAQGLNMSLRDAAQAAEFVLARSDPGSADTLAEYDRLRRLDVEPRGQAVDLMNRSLLSDVAAMAGARVAGLALLRRVGPLRRHVMRVGMGTAGALPQAMR